MRERFHTLVIGAAVLAVSAFAPLAAQDDVSHVRIVRLSFIQGSVTLQPTGAGDRAARLYDPVQEGFLLRTHADSFAEVEFENGSTARLGEDSEIFFEQLALANQTGGKLNRLSLRRGYATFNIDLAREDIFEVEAQGTEIELEESAEFRVDLDTPQTHIKVFDGRVFVEGPMGTVEVEANQTLTMNPDGEELIELRSGITEDAWDQWNRERDKLRTLQARGGTLGGAPYDDRDYDGGHVYSTRVYHDHHYYRDYPIYYGYPYRYGYPNHHRYYGHAYYPFGSGFGIHFGFNYGSPYRYAWTRFTWYPWHYSSHSAFHFSGHNRFRGFNRLRRTNFAVSPFVPRVDRRRLRSRIFLNRTLSGSSHIARGDRTGFGVRRTNFAGAVRVQDAAVTSVTPVFGGGNRRARNVRRVGTGSRNIVRNRINQSRRSRIFLSRGNANSNSIVFDRTTRTFTNGPAATTSNSRSQSRRARQLRQGRVSSQAGSTSPSRVRSSRSRRNSNLNTSAGQRGSIQGRSRRGSSGVVLRSNQNRDSRVSTSPSRVRSSRSRRNSNLNTSAGQRGSIQGRSRRGSSGIVLRSNQNRDSRVSTSPSRVRSSRSRRNSNLNTSAGQRGSIQGRSRRGSSRVMLRSNQNRDSRVSTSRQATSRVRRVGRDRNPSQVRKTRTRNGQTPRASFGADFARSQRASMQDRVRRLSSGTVARSNPANTGTVKGPIAGRTSRSRRVSAPRTNVSRSSNSAARSRARSARTSPASTSARTVRTPQRALARTRSSARAQSFNGSRSGASRQQRARNLSSSRSSGRSRAFTPSPSRNRSGASRTSASRSSGSRGNGGGRSSSGGGGSRAGSGGGGSRGGRGGGHGRR